MEPISSFAHLFTLPLSVLCFSRTLCQAPTPSVLELMCNTRWHPNLPVTHGSVGRLYDEGLLLAFPTQLLDVVLELSVLCGEDPGPGYEVVLLGLALAHSEREQINQCVHVRSHQMSLECFKDSGASYIIT